MRKIRTRLLLLSLLTNIVLINWFMRKRAEEVRNIQLADQALAGLADVNTRIEGVTRSLQDQELRTIARIDQLDAFIEERRGYVE